MRDEAVGDDGEWNFLYHLAWKNAVFKASPLREDYSHSAY